MILDLLHVANSVTVNLWPRDVKIVLNTKDEYLATAFTEAFLAWEAILQSAIPSYTFLFLEHSFILIMP